MNTVELQATTREANGKGGARKLRETGRIPGILYGHSGATPVAVDGKSFELMLRDVSSGNTILDVRLEGREGEEIKALIKEVQRDPRSEHVVHFDLEHISMTQRVRVHVPVHLKGASKGVKAGGILEFLVRDLEVECLASDIPDEIPLDVTDLEIGDSVHVRDLNLEHLTIHTPAEQVLVAVAAKAKEEEPVEAAETAEGEAETPEGEQADAKETTEES